MKIYHNGFKSFVLVPPTQRNESFCKKQDHKSEKILMKNCKIKKVYLGKITVHSLSFMHRQSLVIFSNLTFHEQSHTSQLHVKYVKTFFLQVPQKVIIPRLNAIK